MKSRIPKVEERRGIIQGNCAGIDIAFRLKYNCTVMNKLQLTITNEEAALLTTRAERIGYTLSRYVKFLIGKEAMAVLEEDTIPTYTMSDTTEKIALEALKSHRNGKTIKLNNPKSLAKL